ncbi:MAG TPA: ornithine carbamoyltransferase, partial [bacterium]|nr:ornithine carbamoyltransferase [bacterium]
MRKDLISIADFSREDICRFFSLAAVLKKQRRDGVRHPLLEGKVMAMIFEKPSLRTRVTFETGMFDLGGTAIYLSPSDIGLGKRESVKDTAENLERWVHLIMARTFSHRAVEELADSCSIPVINALTDLLHPCQVLADLLTVIEHFDLDPADPDFGGIDFAFISDGNNVANSWINAAGVLGFSFTISCPEGYDPDPGIWAEAEKRGAALASVRDPRAAAEAKRVIYTDTWASMGQE